MKISIAVASLLGAASAQKMGKLTDIYAIGPDDPGIMDFTDSTGLVSRFTCFSTNDSLDPFNQAYPSIRDFPNWPYLAGMAEVISPRSAMCGKCLRVSDTVTSIYVTVVDRAGGDYEMVLSLDVLNELVQDRSEWHKKAYVQIVDASYCDKTYTRRSIEEKNKEHKVVEEREEPIGSPGYLA